MNLRAKANTDIEGGFALFLFDQGEPGAELKPISAKLSLDAPIAVGEATALDPFLIIPDSRAQALLNDLWNAGLRPDGYTEGSETPAVIRAKDDHIAFLQETVRCLLPSHQTS